MASLMRIGGSVMVGAGLVAAYVKLCRTLSSQQQQLLYSPSSLAEGHDDHHPIFSTRHSDVLRGWVENHGSDHAVVYYGGSSEQVELRRDMLRSIMPQHTLYFVPYRGFGPNHHWSPHERQLKEDAEDLFDFVQSRHTKVSVIGRSLGTSMAMHVGARKPIHRLAVVTPFSSILRIAQDRYKWAPVKNLLKDHHEVWKDAPQVQSPILACLAAQDTITPRKFWDELHQMIGDRAQVFCDNVSDHNTIAFSQMTWQAIADFFTQPSSSQASQP